MIPRNSLRLRIKHRFPIHQEAIMVMPMSKRNLCEPGAIRLPLHGVRHRIPIVEIAHQMDMPGFRCDTHKINGLGHFFGGITVGCEV